MIEARKNVYFHSRNKIKPIAYALYDVGLVVCIDSVFLLGLHLSEEFLLLVLDLLLPGLGGELLVGPPLLGHLLILLCLPDGVGADGGVGLLVDGLDTVGVDAVLDVSAEDK